MKEIKGVSKKMIPFWFPFIQKWWKIQTSSLRSERYIYWEIVLGLNKLLIVHIFDMATISVKTSFHTKAEILVHFLPSVISYFSSVCLHVLLQLHQGTGLVGIHYTFEAPQNQKSRGFRSGLCGAHSCSVHKLMRQFPKSPWRNWTDVFAVCGVAPSCMNQVSLNCSGVSFWDRSSWNLCIMTQ